MSDQEKLIRHGNVSPSDDWIEDCQKFHGRILRGTYAHWCTEWDDMPIDETCVEFKSCICYE